MQRASVVAAIFLLATSGTSQGQQEMGPGVRNAHGMASDGKCVLLFGGANAEAVLHDTWCWRNGAWALLTTSGPAARTFPGMAGDAGNQRVFLFGGNRVLFGQGPDPANILDDFWIWEGSQWRQVAGLHPPGRAEAGMAYDVHRERLVLFGGYRLNGDRRERLGDTWEWDGGQWRQVSDQGPTARNGVAMAYDSSRRRVVLFGGSGGPSDETWEWNGREWKPIRTPATPGRYNAAMAFDPQGQALIRFGGWDGKKRTSDTWAFTGLEWRSIAGPAPPPRNHAAMAFDESAGTLILFGGHDGPNVLGDLWEFRGHGWVQRVAAAPQRRIDNGH